MCAPLPFMGQKRMFLGKFRNVLKLYPDNMVIVDLFGGSGLLAHVAKREKPASRVVFNDYDGYHKRIDNIWRTNSLLRDIRTIADGLPKNKAFAQDVKQKILERIKQDELTGFVDYITLSSSLLFSMKYRLSLDGLAKETMYNNVRLSDYVADGYLDGLEIVCMDYKELFEAYKDVPNVLFLVDPPYLGTEVGTYKMSWGLADYLDVVTVLQGKQFVYFTSNKSSIVELCEWIEHHRDMVNPFKNAGKEEFHAHVNYNSKYTDIMIYSDIG